ITFKNQNTPFYGTYFCKNKHLYIMLYFHAKLLLLYIYRFKTVSGLTFCSNPQKPWVKRAIEFVDKKWSALETTAHLLNSAPTSKTTLTLDKASNWNG
uniref:Uncharacterized protein n=1 Tax=Cyprinus carpio TaxID=7962 RepID=A0A8C2HLH6_CYPCA